MSKIFRFYYKKGIFHFQLLSECNQPSKLPEEVNVIENNETTNTGIIQGTVFTKSCFKEEELIALVTRHLHLKGLLTPTKDVIIQTPSHVSCE